MVNGRGEIYSARQSLGMQGRDRQDCFHIIVPSSSSQRYPFVCRVFFFLLFCSCVLLCVSLCACEGQKESASGREGGYRVKMEYRGQICVCKRAEEKWQE